MAVIECLTQTYQDTAFRGIFASLNIWKKKQQHHQSEAKPE